MARKASAEAAKTPAPTTNVDFAKALSIIETADSLKSEVQEHNGELSAVWKRVEEECGVNKAAAKLFLTKVKKAADDRRWDFLRSFMGLMKAANIEIPVDLVDQAEQKSNVTPLPGLGGNA